MYLDFFGLRDKPFNVTPDPHFLYMSSAHQEAFANLLYGIEERKGFIVLTGEVGTGKTTLLQNLLANLDRKVEAVYVFHSGLSFDEMLILIHEELSIRLPRDHSRRALLRSLNAYLIAQLKKDRNVVLILDEAQNLSPDFLENLRQLSNLETTREKLLQIVLVGQPELDDKLSLPELRQLTHRVAVSARIHSLQPDDVESYILHRMALAGAGEEEVFSREALDILRDCSGGIPRRINMLCDNALLIAYAEGNRKIQKEHLEEAIQDSRVRDRRKWRVPRLWSSKSYTSSSLPLMIVAMAFIVLMFSATRKAREGSDSLPSSAIAIPEREQLDSRTPEAAAPSALPEAESLPAPTTLSLTDLPIAPRQDLPGSSSLSHRVERRQWFREMMDQMDIEELASAILTIPYLIQEGDHFGKIVETSYTLKDSRYQSLLKLLNPHIEDFNLLRPGWTINIPLMEVSP